MKMMPIQTPYRRSEMQGLIAEEIYMKAYEVYCYIYGPQQAMIEGGCRGGFSVGELVGFLYAASFPKDQWRHKVNEAFNGGMENIK